MNQGLYTAVGAMRSAEQRIEFTSHNLANLGTPGFKRRAHASSQFRILTDTGEKRAVGTSARQDFQQGPFQRTGSALHVALEGPGFLSVESPDGEIYTRRGELVIDGDGELKAEGGNPVAWERRLGTFDALGDELTIEPDGTVHQGVTQLGRLKLTDFEDYSQLTELTDGYWAAGENARTTNAAATLRQGELEGSNATGIDEMVELIANQRFYDLASRAVRSIDQSYQRLNRPS